MWWTCPKILKYWGKIHKAIRDILNVKFDFNPKYYFLGIRPLNLLSSMKDFSFCAKTAARLSLASKWRQQIVPKIEDWLDKMRKYASILMLSRHLDPNDNEESQDSWDMFYQYLLTL